MLDQLLKTSYDEFTKASSSSVKTITTPLTIFDGFLKKCIQHHGQPVHSFLEMRTIKSTKAKGDLFELFCQRYLLKIKDYDQVWLLKEMTDDLKFQLKLPFGRGDYGIDLFAMKIIDGQPTYSAIQCKFKTPRAPIQVKNYRGETKTIFPSVGWKELSTFNELCNASGPWRERITMTTAKSVRRMGGIKNEIDRSICLQGLQGLTPQQWVKLMDSSVPHLSTTQVLSSEQVPEIQSETLNQPPTTQPKIVIKLKSQTPTQIPVTSVIKQPKTKVKDKVKPSSSPQLNIDDLRNKRLEYLYKSGILKQSNEVNTQQ